MKKLVSCILAVSVMVTTLLCGTASVAAAESDNSGVAELDIWNHEFQNEISDDVLTALENLSDTDTIAISVMFFGSDDAEIDDIYQYAEKNNRLDEIVITDDMYDASEALSADYYLYVSEVLYKDALSKKEIVNKQYSVAEIDYYGSLKQLICEATKEQVLKLADADIFVVIGLASKEYYDEENLIPWEDYFYIEQQTREYIESNIGVSCSEDEYDVLYIHSALDVPVIIVLKTVGTLGSESKVFRSGNIVWLNSSTAEGAYYYSGGLIRNLGELYQDGAIDADMFYQLGGRFFGDIDGNKTVNVNDVTYLQRFLNGSIGYDDEGIAEEIIKLFSDVDDNGKVDVNDVTALQNYISTAVSAMPS